MHAHTEPIEHMLGTRGPVENLWGVRTTYGMHPTPPTRWGTRAKRAATKAAVIGLAAWYFIRR